MKNKTGIVLVIFGAITILAGIIRIVSIVSNASKQPATITIIGGADGPTTAFIVEKYGFSMGILPFVGIVLLVIGIILLLKKKN